MVHSRPIAGDILTDSLASEVKADLGDPATLAGICDGVDCVVFLAGVLFRPYPASYLRETNVEFVRNLLEEAKHAGVSKFIVASFPHVEGPTSPQEPARGRLDCKPGSIHARTRLEAERLLMESCAEGPTAPIVFRAGIVYGPDLKLIEWAGRLIRARLMAVWSEPTWIQLISLPDFLEAVTAMIEREGVRGIYHLGDDEPLTMQQAIDILARHWGRSPPRRLPAWTFRALARGIESAAALIHTRTPLHLDLIETAMISAVGDTSRTRDELIPQLKYTSLESGLELLK